MQDNDEISVVRRWIASQKVKLVNEIQVLHAKIKVFDDMEKELNRTIGSASPPPPPVLQLQSQPERTPRPWSIGEKAKADTLLALQAAGDVGLSSKEFADLAQVPKGTASARLSVVKSLGLATLKQHKYFAVHSTQEDNNVSQGGELQ